MMWSDVDDDVIGRNDEVINVLPSRHFHHLGLCDFKKQEPERYFWSSSLLFRLFLSFKLFS